MRVYSRAYALHFARGHLYCFCRAATCRPRKENNMKKKLIVIALILVLVLSVALVACNEKETTTPTDPDTGNGPVDPDDGNEPVDPVDPSIGNGTFVDLSAMPEGTAGEYAYLYSQYPLATDDSYFGTYGGPYQGHPDSVLLDNGNILAAFPKSHGRSETIMMLSTDGGVTWTDIFNDENVKPDSFYHTEETPTIYKLDFTDGTQKLITISGRPSWADQPGDKGEGWDAAVSSSLGEDGKCNGLVWSEHENFYGPNATREEYKRAAGAEKYDAVVAMSSLTQMKDENGNYIDKWMGTYHDDRNFTVYKTYLTFNEDGLMEWSEPERLLGQNGEWRQVETDNDFCEVEVLRSPDGNELAALFRVNNKLSCSYVSFSEDEGATWSEPQTVAAELTGERHKAEYDPVSGKLIITMRSIVYPRNNPNLGWYSYGWVAWIGDYEDLKRGEDGHGDMLVKLAHTYGVNGEEIALSANADTGYAGLTVMADGTVVTISYGTFSPASDEELGGKTYIMAKRFKVNDLAAVGGVTLR